MAQTDNRVTFRYRRFFVIRSGWQKATPIRMR